MGFLDFFRSEKRGEVPAGSVPVSSSNFLELITGFAGASSASGVSVNIEKALGVTPIWAAVNFLSGTLAGLPLNLYQRDKKDGRKILKGGLATMLHDAVNEELTSFAWRKRLFDQVFTGGRALTFIERNQRNEITNLWPLDPNQTKAKREGGRTFYESKDGTATNTYQAAEIIDISFMLKSNGLAHRGPIMTNKDTIGLAIAATNYSSKFFQNGGVPPFAVSGNFQSAKTMGRAASDFADAVRKASKEERLALVLPAGLEIKSLGVDLEKAQMVELQRFLIEQIARIYSLPPIFLQDLTHGTFTNTEQQDLHLVKHTLTRWVNDFEQQLNLKLFGRSNTRRYVEANIDGLLRGDFKTRMEGYGQAINSAVMRPNEARRKENLPDDPDGDKLMIQGGTVAIASQNTEPPQEPQDGA